MDKSGKCSSGKCAVPNGDKCSAPNSNSGKCSLPNSSGKCTTKPKDDGKKVNK